MSFDEMSEFGAPALSENQKTLDLNVPDQLLVVADEVIECEKISTYCTHTLLHLLMSRLGTVAGKSDARCDVSYGASADLREMQKATAQKGRRSDVTST
jgi:hypothetical protein